MESDQVQLITEQLGRLSDKITARLSALESQLTHDQELGTEKIGNLAEKVADLRKVADDHETRLRAVADTSNRSQTILSLFSGGSLVASVAALIKAFLGTP